MNQYYDALIPGEIVLVSVFPNWGFRLKSFIPIQKKSIWEKIVNLSFPLVFASGILIDAYFWTFNPANSSKLIGTYSFLGFALGIFVMISLSFLFSNKVKRWRAFLLQDAEKTQTVWQSSDFVVNLKNYEKLPSNKSDFILSDKIGVLRVFKNSNHVIRELDSGIKIKEMKRILYRFHPQYSSFAKNKFSAEIPVTYTSNGILLSLLPSRHFDPTNTPSTRIRDYQLGDLLDFIVRTFPQLEDQEPVYYETELGEIYFHAGALLKNNLEKLLGVQTMGSSP